MANLNSSATVSLNINGAAAADAMKKLEQRASELRKKMDQCTIKGDITGAQRLQKQLDRVDKRYKKLTESNVDFNRTVRNLDTASLKDLEATLRRLQSQIKTLDRNSEAWKHHAALIRRVKAEINAANASLQAVDTTTKGVAGRVLDFFGKWQVKLLGVAAAFAGVMQGMRSAVRAFAEIDESMADTRKFTGMTREQVEDLNEEFRRMDTRTARETLNALAQEAGRLGKHTKEEVMGYVKAADIINVALSDLGEGATQSIAKLSNIFKLEDRHGTYDAMLRIGSVVNVLSQNCTASKPYLVEFANRLAGVGNQAHISLQNIIGLGAVLDANAQKVEASSTAIGQVITRMYREPAKYARVAGLDVKKFTELLKKDANEALLQFLETLGKAGNMDVLAPMFADMEENGSRVISALATLAKHVDEVRAQQAEANRAFREGTSVLNEYNIFNNTAQAGFDKSRKRIRELAVEIGEKLAPVLRYAAESSAALLGAVSSFMSFVSRNSKELVVLASALASYYVAANTAALKTALLTRATQAWAVLCKGMPAVLGPLRMGAVATANALQFLTNGFKVNMAMQRRWAKAALLVRSANPAGLFIAAATAAVAFSKVIANLIANYNTLSGAARVMNGIRTEAAKKVEEEKTKINALLEAAKDLNRTEAERLSICAELNKAVPNLSATIDRMTGSLVYNNKALEKHVQLLTHMYEIEGAKAKIAELGKERAELVVSNTGLQKEKEQIEAERALNWKTYAGKPAKATVQAGNAPSIVNWAVSSAGQTAAVERQIEQNNRALKMVDQQLKTIYESYNILELTGGKEGRGEEGVPDGGGSYSSAKQTEKEAKKAAAEARRAAVKARKEFKAELDAVKGEWEEAEARNIAQRSQGIVSWSEYLERKHELEGEYLDGRMKVYERHNLQEDEDYKDLLKKKEQHHADWLRRKASMEVEAAKLAQKAEELQTELDYSTPGNAMFQNEEARQTALFDIRIKYLHKMRAAYDAASEEYHNYTLQAEEAEEQEKLRLQKRYAELYRKYSAQYALFSVKERMEMELKMLQELLYKKLISEKEYQKALERIRREGTGSLLPESAKPDKSASARDEENRRADLEKAEEMYRAKLLTEEEYLQARERIEAKYQKRALDRVKSAGGEVTAMLIDLVEAFGAFGDEDDGRNVWLKMAGAAQAAFAVMNAAMGAYSEFAKAETDILVAKIEKRYDAEAALAQGNVFKQKQAEKKKQKEIAKAKNEASRKQFAMQVIQAVGQTAVNALNAYGSAAAVPVIGHILAPIAAAMAVAAGMVQVAAIRKQAQAAEAAGYMEGGFTPKGRRDEAVGVVHAGEWVAPQEIVENPVTRPIVNLLENARRSNRIGSIRHADVSAASPVLTAARVSARTAEAPRPDTAGGGERADSGLSQVLTRLTARLEEPFVTVNTVTGDYGIKRAQDEYDRLMKNKSYKRR